MLFASIGTAVAQDRQATREANAKKVASEKLRKGGPDLNSAKTLPEVVNPRAVESDASTLSALQNQKRSVDAELATQTKLTARPAVLKPTGPSRPMASQNGGMLGGSSGNAAPVPVSAERIDSQAQSAQSSAPAPNSRSYSMAGGGTINPPVAGNSKFGTMPVGMASNLALTCSTNPMMRIITVAGMPAPAVFTPISAYDLYTVTGCSFGNAGPDAKAYLYKGGTFREDFQIQEWHDNWLKISLDPKISGVLDQDEVTLVIQRADGTQVSKGGFKFHAVRSLVPLQLIPSRWATLVTWSQENKTFSPEYSSPALIDGKAAGPSAYVSRYLENQKFDPNAQPANQQYDSYDFSGLAPGWIGKSAQLQTYGTRCPLVVTYRGDFGTWRTQWEGNTLRVYLADETCTWFNPAFPPDHGDNWTGSYYKLTVSAYGPRCTDPLTGKPDTQCMQQVAAQ